MKNNIIDEVISRIPYEQNLELEKSIKEDMFNSAQKKLKDKYNHLNSLLQQEKKVKLSKILNTEKINKLEIEINLLKELMK